MYEPARDWNPYQNQLREMICRPECFSEAMELCRKLHAFVHSGDVYGNLGPTLADLAVDGLPDEDYSVMPTKRDVTIAWNLWHIARIEDLTMNLLVDDGNQVLDELWKKRLGIQVTDTGNAMTDDEILSFSREVDKAQLLAYRSAVGRRSREILDRLTPVDMKRKFRPEQAERIVTEGGLTEHPDSIWLRDFWGKKDVAGILLLPLTRHQAGHLNDCLKLRVKIQRMKSRSSPNSSA